ncbi:MAG: NERD domain-containing protein [Rhodoglobus sp.]
MTNVMVRGSRVTTSSAGLSAQTRGPAYSAVIECLRIQGSAPRRSLVGRFFGQSPLTSSARSWYRAALSELRLARLETVLSSEYTILNSLPLGDDESHIERIVVGPAGVFTVISKNHARQRVWVSGDVFLVNGHRTHHIGDALYEASRLTRLLSAGVDAPIDVTPVIAVVDPGSLTIKSESARVVVVTENHLARMIMRRPRVLSVSEADAIVARARLFSSNHASEYEHVMHASTDGHARFSRLRQEVGSAARRRLLWVVAGVLGVVSSVFLMTTGIV